MKDKDLIDRIASRMADGMSQEAEELIADLRANDPGFKELDRQITEHLRKIHDGEESPPNLDSTSPSGP